MIRFRHSFIMSRYVHYASIKIATVRSKATRSISHG